MPDRSRAAPLPCMLPEHKPCGAGARMINLLAWKSRSLRRRKLRGAVVTSSAIVQRMRCLGSALTPTSGHTPGGRYPTKDGRRDPPQRTGTTGEWPPAPRRSPPASAKDGPGAGRLLGVVFEAVVPSGCSNATANTRSGERQPVRCRDPGDHAVAGGVAARWTDDQPGATSTLLSNVRICCGTRSRPLGLAEARPGTPAAWRRGEIGRRQNRLRRPPGGPAGPDAAVPHFDTARGHVMYPMQRPRAAAVELRDRLRPDLRVTWRPPRRVLGVARFLPRLHAAGVPGRARRTASGS